MRRIVLSVLFGLCLVAGVGLTVYSQSAGQAPAPQVQVLQGGLSQQIPVDVTILLPTETGVQTVTVPLLLNLDLSIGPVEALGLDVQVDTASPFISPLTVVGPSVESSTAITP